MKLRTTKYVVKEGFINTYRNVLMSLASIGVVTATLFVFGFIWLLTVNLNHNTNSFKENPVICVFCSPELDESQIDTIQKSIEGDSRIKEFNKVSKEEAFKKAEEMLGEDKVVLEGIGNDFLPVSFEIKLNNLEEAEFVAATLREIPGVGKVKYSQNEVEIVSKTIYWVQIGSSFLIVLLLIISIFIISNTIKLTVFARRKEINIMKYIGATDWFIRWPFIVEGVIIGLVGALVSFGAISIIYTFAFDWISKGIKLISIIKISEVAVQLLLIFSVIGANVGAVGSAISIRKYLRV